MQMSQHHQLIYSIQQIRQAESLAQSELHLSEADMMLRAAQASLDLLLRQWPNTKTIAIFCGTGNNGGDGYTLALLAERKGLKPTLWQVGDHARLSGEAKKAYTACKHSKLTIHIFNQQADVGKPDLCVDAICGIGVTSTLRPEIMQAITIIESLAVPILSLDVPTGIHADTGVVLGGAIHASVTITFIGLKLGLLTGPGVAYTGALFLNDLHFPDTLFSHLTPQAEVLSLNEFSHYLKPRARDWHKGLAGHVLIIGGDSGFTGAPRMAAEAALRVGAGLVSIATRSENAAIMNVTLPEIMCHAVEHVHELDHLLEKVDVIVIGPGLGQSSWAQALLDRVCKTPLPILLDADALNLLAKQPHSRDEWILTPHPGEAARLLDQSTQTIQHQRATAIRDLQSKYGGIIVLKGAGTLIASPNRLLSLCDRGNPGMATGGMGDVLSGVIGGLCAQGIPIADAARLGVLLHALAGDLAAQQGERGLIATDLMQFLHELSNAQLN